MSQVKWSEEQSIHLPELDAEHRSVYQLAAELKSYIVKHAPKARIAATLRALLAEMEDHLGHEERIMTLIRYPLIAWHKGQHDNIRRRATEAAKAIQSGDLNAGKEFIDYFNRWLRDHMAVADNMMGAAIRNYQRAHAA